MAAALLTFAVSCGGSTASTFSPTIGTITGISLAVNPPGVGATVQAVATVSLSTGKTADVAAGFTSDTLSVATVTAAGAVTGVSVGDVTIAVDYQGFKASKKVRVLPNYNGIFYGTYTLDSCTESGDFAAQGYCAMLQANAALSIGMNNAQSADLTAMTGQFALGTLAGTGTGTVSSAGALTYSGSIVGGTSRIDVQNFAGTVPATGQIAGRFEQLWIDTSMTGQLLLKCTIHDLTRSSGGVAVASEPGRAVPATLADRVAAWRHTARR